MCNYLQFSKRKSISLKKEQEIDADAKCPVLWQSKLETETVLSTMGSDVIVLVYQCQEFFHTLDMASLLETEVGPPLCEVKMNVSMCGDNAVSLVLLETLSPKFMSGRSTIPFRLFCFVN